MTTDNGILARIRGQDIAAALNTLPPAESCETATVETEYDVPDVGRVRFTVERCRSKRGKFVRYFWTACRAVLV